MFDLLVVLLVAIGAAFAMLVQHRRASVSLLGGGSVGQTSSAALDQAQGRAPFRDFEHMGREFIIPPGFSLSRTAPKFNEQIQRLLGHVVKDFIISWFKPLCACRLCQCSDSWIAFPISVLTFPASVCIFCMTICTHRHAPGLSDDFPRDVCDVLSYILAVGASRAEHIDWTAFAANRLFKLLRELLRIFRAAESNVVAKHPGMGRLVYVAAFVSALSVRACILGSRGECNMALRTCRVVHNCIFVMLSIS